MCVLCVTIVPTVVLKAIFDDDTRAREIFLKTTKVKKKVSRDDDCVSFSSFRSPLLDVVLVEVVEIVFVDAAFPIFFFYFFFFFFSRDEDDE